MKLNHITIQGWMYDIGCSDLREIVAYAVVYGFSQDGESKFQGSLTYIMQLLKCSKHTAIDTLKSLESKGLIKKEQVCMQGVVFNKYSAVMQVVKDLDTQCKNCTTGANSTPNNIDIVSTKVETVRENNTPCLFEDNIGDTTPYNPPTTSEQEQMFDEFRRAYRGTKRGLRTEFENFRKKHKDWRDVLVHLLADYQRQVQVLDANKAAGAFVPQPKNLQTYINQRCWEEEISLTTQTGTPYGNTVIGREAARVQAGLGCIRAGLNAAHTERSTGQGTP